MRKTIRIERIDLPYDLVLSDVKTLEDLEQLCRHGESLLESDTDYYLVRGFMAYRFSKPEAKPRIIKAQQLELNPDAYRVKVELTLEQLFAFAKIERLFLFETEDGYYIPSDTILFAKKKDKTE